MRGGDVNAGAGEIRQQIKSSGKSSRKKSRENAGPNFVKHFWQLNNGDRRGAIKF